MSWETWCQSWYFKEIQGKLICKFCRQFSRKTFSIKRFDKFLKMFSMQNFHDEVAIKEKLFIQFLSIFWYLIEKKGLLNSFISNYVPFWSSFEKLFRLFSCCFVEYFWEQLASSCLTKINFKALKQFNLYNSTKPLEIWQHSADEALNFIFLGTIAVVCRAHFVHWRGS